MLKSSQLETDEGDEMAVREITLQLPEDIYQQLAEAAKRSRQSMSDIAIRSLQFGLNKNAPRVDADEYNITHTHTWLLRGTLEINEPEADYIIGKDEDGTPITNYAENVDDVLYG